MTLASPGNFKASTRVVEKFSILNGRSVTRYTPNSQIGNNNLQNVTIEAYELRHVDSLQHDLSE